MKEWKEAKLKTASRYKSSRRFKGMNEVFAELMLNMKLLGTDLNYILHTYLVGINP
jgi:hypothetical protein